VFVGFDFGSGRIARDQIAAQGQTRR
jgi:hypothetical protein